MAFEFKSGSRLRDTAFKALTLFGEDYPQSKRYIVYGGTTNHSRGDIKVLSASTFFSKVEELL